MVSGVGPSEHLIENGIEVVLDSPKVGQNMQDHVAIPLVLTGQRGIRSAVKNFDILSNLDKVPSASILGFASLNKMQNVADYEATLFPTPAFSTLPSLLCTYLFQLDDRHCMTLPDACQISENLFSILAMLHLQSRGEIRLKSNNPEIAPAIHTKYFSNPQDLDKFAFYIEDYLSVMNTTYFKKVKSKVVDIKLKQCKAYTFGSHEYWKCFVLNVAMTQGHPVGTCAMGARGVVDYRLRVHGLQGLRVVDASVMPQIISGNINAAVVAIAEKAADIIRQDHRLVCARARG